LTAPVAWRFRAKRAVFRWENSAGCPHREDREPDSRGGGWALVRPIVFITGCDSPPKIHLAPVTVEPNAAACRVQTKFPRAIPGFEILGALLGTAAP
jgi:hypothetical protein